MYHCQSVLRDNAVENTNNVPLGILGSFDPVLFNLGLNCRISFKALCSTKVKARHSSDQMCVRLFGVYSVDQKEILHTRYNGCPD